MNIQSLFIFLVNLASNQDALLKIALVLLLLLFILFTLILARQISVLTHLINQVDLSSFYQVFAYGITIAAIILLIAVIFV